MSTFQTKVKMSGYLGKKSKKRVLNTWKTYWFVLEDRLLLFYRSQNEYQAISPCKGSINLGPPCTVKSFPSIENSFQIETRTNTFTLKATNPEEQLKWMQTIMAALNQNQNFVSESQKRLSHFRYSLNNLIPEREPNDDQKNIFERQDSVPNNTKALRKNSAELIQRLQKIGAQSYVGNSGIIGKITKNSTSPIETRPTITLEESINFSDTEHLTEILRKDVTRDNNIYERISGESNSSHGSNRLSFMVDNDNYSVPLRRPKSSASQQSANNIAVKETQSLLVENDQYIAIQDYKNEIVYAEPNINDNLDVNHQYVPIQGYKKEEAIYAEPNIKENTDVNKNSVIRENSIYAITDINTCSENVYEVVDNYNIYSVLNVKDEPPAIPSSTKMCMNNHDKENPNRKLKKSKSFIKIGWRKRNKKKIKDQPEEKNNKEIVVDPIEKTESSNDNTLQMLSELQNILESKKSKLKPAVFNSSNSGNSQPWHSIGQLSETSQSQISDCFNIPPKNQTTECNSTTITSNRSEKCRSLDEIIKDLDEEKMKSNNIEQQKFDEEPNEVVLRAYEKPNFRVPRHSDDLNLLLEELIKVTSAPIMTPGVTSSLINSNLTDAEWKKLLPVRQRRLSEPDYDVPRSHKSITFPIEPENSDAIPATRFFGPVLSQAVTDNSPTEESLTSSMTPDSLEVESQMAFSCQDSDLLDETSRFPPISHDPQSKVIYSLPKSYVSVATQIVNTCHNIYGSQLSDDYIIYKNVKNIDIQDEVYSDSLEVPNEQPKY